MPSRPARVCDHCRRTVPAGQRCQCRPERKPWAGSSYGNSGTTRRQQRIREQQLTAHPICQWPGCRRLATNADHIVNLAAGGERYDPANYQSLCKPHHDAKTAHEAAQGRQRRRRHG